MSINYSSKKNILHIKISNVAALKNIQSHIRSRRKYMLRVDLRNSITECAQSVKKENAGKFYNYGIKDCIKSIAAQKQQ